MTIKTKHFKNHISDLPMIEVVVTPPFDIVNTLEKENKGIPFKRLWFLIDTGASASIIQTGVSEKLGLKPEDWERTILNALGKGKSKVYKVQLIFLKNEIIINIPVSELDYKGRKMDGIMGRDLLKYFVFTYHGPDKSFTLCS